MNDNGNDLIPWPNWPFREPAGYVREPVERWGECQPGHVRYERWGIGKRQQQNATYFATPEEVAVIRARYPESDLRLLPWDAIRGDLLRAGKLPLDASDVTAQAVVAALGDLDGEPKETGPTGRGTLFVGEPPENPDIQDLVVRLDANNGKPTEERLPQIDVARGMLGNDPGDRRAKSLLAQIRRLKRAGKINLT